MSDTLFAGYSKQDITPKEQVPLSGYFTYKERLSGKVHNSLYVRTIALRIGEMRVVIAAADLLMVIPDLRNAVLEKLPDFPSQNLFLCGTHTHSGPGGYWNNSRIKVIMGSFRQQVLEMLASSIAESVRQAIIDEAPAKIFLAESCIHGFTASRRNEKGDTDNNFKIIRLERDNKKDIEIYNYSGHPVVVAEHQPDFISSDFPGIFMDFVENERDILPISFIASLGGISVLFPEYHIKLDEHLNLLLNLLVRERDEAAKSLCEINSPVNELQLLTNKLDIPDKIKSNVYINGLFSELSLEIMSYPLSKIIGVWAKKLITPGDEFELSFMRLGNITFAGFPLDTGVSIIKACREYALKDDFPIFASQCNNYFGYLHMPHVYLEKLYGKSDQKRMAVYENMLNFLGKDFGLNVVNAYLSCVNSSADL